MFQNMCSHARKCLLGVLLILYHLGDFKGENPQFSVPVIGNPIIKKIANNSKTVRGGEKVTLDHLLETGVGLSESAVVLVAMAVGLGETLHRFSRKCIKCL